jgi:hypothetical protein
MPASIYVQFALVDRVNQATDPEKQGSKVSARGKVRFKFESKRHFTESVAEHALARFHLPGRWKLTGREFRD